MVEEEDVDKMTLSRRSLGADYDGSSEQGGAASARSEVDDSGGSQSFRSEEQQQERNRLNESRE
jgi:hypothetical protein